MIRRMFRLKSAAVAGIVGTVTLGLQPVMASEASAAPEAAWVRTPSISGIERFSTTQHVPAAAPEATWSARQTAAADVQAARSLVSELLKSSDPAKVALGKRISPWLDVASATTQAERHAAIQKLPVTVILTSPKSGRPGILKTFVVGGKVRASRFVPAAFTLPNPGVEPEGDGVGGPHLAVEMDGRWKSDGNGGCYWDAADSGPNQCTPPGRWKIGTECYWDANDSGPDQCTPPNPPSTCYFDGAPADCATQQDIDDALALVASATAEVEQAQADADAEMEEIEAYCDQNPGACDNTGQRIAGPSCTDMPCLGEFGRFTAAAITTNVAVATLAGVAAATAAPALAFAGASLAVSAGLFAMFGTGVSLLDCKRAHVG